MYHIIIMNLEDILKLALEKNASDIHLKAGMAPVIRKSGTLRPLATDLKPMTGEEIESIAHSMLTDEQRKIYQTKREVDVGYGVKGLGRFRVSVFKQRGTARIVLRHIPHKVPNFEELHLPSQIETLAKLERGLILVTGVAGSGKSSTLAAIVDHINQTQNKHILTIEDPIEYLIRDRKSLITQREVGVDTKSFAEALRAGLRQDPDVILIGEMRDRETIETALLAAETGHLVLSTLHTLDATETVNRILSTFEAPAQKQIRLQLGAVLQAVISQRLCRGKTDGSFIPAVEILLNTSRVREMIESPEETQEILTAIEEGSQAYGMQSFDQSLMSLLQKDLISFEEALLHAGRPEDFRIRWEGITALDGRKWASETSHKERLHDGWHEMTEVEIVIPEEPRQDSDDDEKLKALKSGKRKK